MTRPLAPAVHTGHATVVVLCATAFVPTSAETFADSASQVLLVELAGGQLVERARFLVRTRGLRSLVVAVAITAFRAAAVNAMPVLYSIQVLGLAEPVVPGLVVCMAAGALLGAWLSPRLAFRWGAGGVMGRATSAYRVLAWGLSWD